MPSRRRSASTISGVYQESGREPIYGREAIESHFRRFFESGVSWNFHAERIIVEGPWGAVAYRFEMARLNGEAIVCSGCAIVETRDGKIRMWREYH